MERSSLLLRRANAADPEQLSSMPQGDLKLRRGAVSKTQAANKHGKGGSSTKKGGRQVAAKKAGRARAEQASKVRRTTLCWSLPAFLSILYSSVLLHAFTIANILRRYVEHHVAYNTLDASAITARSCALPRCCTGKCLFRLCTAGRCGTELMAGRHLA